MKRLGITQRVEIVVEYNERRDSLDHRWFKLAHELGFMPIPLPNISADLVEQLLDSLQLDALILSSGNSLAQLNPDASDAAPERDSFEHALIKAMIKRNKPILGICRGMQVLNHYFGGELSPVVGHAGTEHPLYVASEYIRWIRKEVNSYHSWAIATGQAAGCLTTLAHDNAGNVEAFRHESKAVSGIMWHPERESPFDTSDIDLMTHFLS